MQSVQGGPNLYYCAEIGFGRSRFNYRNELIVLHCSTLQQYLGIVERRSYYRLDKLVSWNNGNSDFNIN